MDRPSDPGLADFESLRARIESRDALIGVVGLGYVGLPVALSFAEAGYRVAGVDLREEKVALIAEGKAHLSHIPDERVAAALESGRFQVGVGFDLVTEADVVIVCVPTPITKGAPDLSSVVFAGEELAKALPSGCLFVLESTTYPGTTEEVLKPLLEADGLVAGRDFLLAYSPERIDPGNPTYDFADIPKVVGGIDEPSTEVAALLYRQVVPKVVTVSGTKEAELSKLIENTFRHVNIALVNELAIYAHEMGIDIWEAIEAAATKPFGFMPFWPSPGWGGHCIPLDPSYLSWKIRQHRAHEVRFVELAQAINSEMPRYTVDRIGLLLNELGKSIRNARILVIGVAYKGGTEDTRGSAGYKIISTLLDRGAEVAYHDPLVPDFEVDGRTLRSVPVTVAELESTDLVAILIPQTGVDWETVASAGLILDCCNALQRTSDRIKRL